MQQKGQNMHQFVPILLQMCLLSVHFMDVQYYINSLVLEVFPTKPQRHFF